VDGTKLSEALFAALATCDDEAVRKLCAPGFCASQNGGPAMNLDTLLGFNAAVHKVVRDFRYDRPVRSATETGFVEEHVVRGTLADGSRLDLQVCVVAEVSGGKVTAVREYVDNKAAEGLIRALTGG
jgi:ketosteroid isomerase-like protein